MTTKIITQLLKDSAYKLTQFSPKELQKLEKRITIKRCL